MGGNGFTRIENMDLGTKIFKIRPYLDIFGHFPALSYACVTKNEKWLKIANYGAIFKKFFPETINLKVLQPFVAKKN